MVSFGQVYIYGSTIVVKSREPVKMWLCGWQMHANCVYSTVVNTNRSHLHNCITPLWRNIQRVQGLHWRDMKGNTCTTHTCRFQGMSVKDRASIGEKRSYFANHLTRTQNSIACTERRFTFLHGRYFFARWPDWNRNNSHDCRLDT